MAYSLMQKDCVSKQDDGDRCSVRVGSNGLCHYHYHRILVGKNGARNTTQLQKDEIVSLYKSGLSASQVAGKVGLSKDTVLRVAKNNGINRTSEMGQGSKYTTKRRTPSPKSYLNTALRKVLSTAEYKSFRKEMFKRDNWQCQMCGYKGSKIQLDHIKPRCLFPELTFDENNVRTLCIDCHKATPTYGIKARRFNEATL